MLDIQFIRDHVAELKEVIRLKKIQLDLDELLKIDSERLALLQELENLQRNRNENANAIKNSGAKPSEEAIEEGKRLKFAILAVEAKKDETDAKFQQLMVKVPTVHAPDTPLGKDESENVESEKWGEPRKFDFTPKDHIALGKDLDILDLERGAKVGGYRGYYVKGDGVLLMMGFMMYAIQKMAQKGYEMIIPPTLIKGQYLFGSGYFKGTEYNADVDEVYKVASPDKDAEGKHTEDKFLVGTSEPSLLAYYSDEVLEESQLPMKFSGYSQCYRSEIGSYGRDTKGVYRVHEFMKVEQVILCPADVEVADALQREMLDISQELHKDLGLPYRALRICTGDLSAGKYKQFDMEAWIPSRNGYGETGSSSNFLDWQARRLNVKYKTKDGDRKHVFMLNNTALPSPRIFIAILENYQNEDGSITVPEVLRGFVGKDRITKK